MTFIYFFIHFLSVCMTSSCLTAWSFFATKKTKGRNCTNHVVFPAWYLFVFSHGDVLSFRVEKTKRRQPHYKSSILEKMLAIRTQKVHLCQTETSTDLVITEVNRKLVACFEIFLISATCQISFSISINPVSCQQLL